MKTKQIVRALSAIAIFAAIAPASFAQSVSGDVDVKANLTSKCRTQSGANKVVDFGVYQAFQPGAATGSTDTVVFECTRGFGGTPVAAWDTTNGTAAGVGVLSNGLQYTLTVSAGARTAGTAASVTTIGTPDLVNYTVGGSMPALQAGNGAGGAVVTQTRTLLVTF